MVFKRFGAYITRVWLQIDILHTPYFFWRKLVSMGCTPPHRDKEGSYVRFFGNLDSAILISFSARGAFFQGLAASRPRAVVNGPVGLSTF